MHDACQGGKGDVDRAELIYDQTLELYREAGDQGGMARAVMNMGRVAWYRKNDDRAHALLTESVPSLRAAHAQFGGAAPSQFS